MTTSVPASAGKIPVSGQDADLIACQYVWKGIQTVTVYKPIKKLAETVGVPNKVAKAFTTAYADMAIAETKKNGVTVLPGIGRLVRVDRKARMGRNPATGEAIKIPAKKVVKFRVAKAVKDSIVPPKKK